MYTINNGLPPNPPVDDWDKSFAESFYCLVNFDKTNFKLDDYDFWVVAFDDENGNAVQREDLNEAQVKEIMDRKDQWTNFERFFLTDKKPHKWVIWAHSKSKGWAERIEHVLNK
jgi:hypothetical protein